jgi:hypothetical protein
LFCHGITTILPVYCFPVNIVCASCNCSKGNVAAKDGLI